jgi:hypothetical protein
MGPRSSTRAASSRAFPSAPHQPAFWIIKFGAHALQLAAAEAGCVTRNSGGGGVRFIKDVSRWRERLLNSSF